MLWSTKREWRHRDVSRTPAAQSADENHTVDLRPDDDYSSLRCDGDLRRMLERNPDYSNLTAGEIMSKNPRTVSPEMLVVNALNLMRKNNITQLLVVENEEYKGVIHLHDILREGII